MVTDCNAARTLDDYAAGLSRPTDGNLRPEEFVTPSEKQPFLYPPTPA